jgi:hypothetical protein
MEPCAPGLGGLACLSIIPRETRVVVEETNIRGSTFFPLLVVVYARYSCEAYVLECWEQVTPGTGTPGDPDGRDLTGSHA